MLQREPHNDIARDVRQDVYGVSHGGLRVAGEAYHDLRCGQQQVIVTCLLAR
jgi:hypothetical protein